MEARNGKNILLVEDEVIIGLSEQKTLEGLGYGVAIAVTGEHAVELFAADPSIDLVLMDMDLGRGMDGAAAAAAMLAAREVPIVFLSSHAEPSILKKIDGLLSYGFVAKTSGNSVLAASVATALRLHEAMRAAASRDPARDRARRDESRLRLLAEILQHPCGSRQEFLDFALAQTIELTGSKLGYIYNYDEVQATFVINSWSAEVMPECRVVNPSARYRLDDTGFWGEAVRQRKAVVVNDYEAESPLKRGLPEGHVRLSRFMTLPVFHDGKIAGVVGLANKGSDYEESDVLQVGLLMDAVWKAAETKRVEAELRRSEERLILAQEAARCGTWEWDLRTDENRWSEELWRMYGLDPARSRASFETWRLSIHPDDRERVVATVVAASSAEREFETEWRTERDGGERWLLSRGKPFRDAEGRAVRYAGIVLEITDRKRAEQAVLESEARYALTLAAVDDGLWDWHVPSGNAFFSPSYFAVLGYSSGEFESSYAGWRALVHPGDIDRVERGLKAAVESERSFAIDLRMRTKAGPMKWVCTRGKAVELDRDGRAVRMVGTLSDITERKCAEQRIIGLLGEKELILKEVHHRIKNNMNTLNSLLMLQAANVRDEAATAALKDAAVRVQSMMTLYDKLYNASYFNAISVRDYLPSLVDEILGNFPNNALVRVEEEIEDFSLSVEKLQPFGIIINELLSNIMKYAFVGRDRGLISISVSSRSGAVHCTVADDGNGLPDRVDFTRPSGFGLMLVAAFAKQLGGSIRLERGSGTKVVLDFVG